MHVLKREYIVWMYIDAFVDVLFYSASDCSLVSYANTWNVSVFHFRPTYILILYILLYYYYYEFVYNIAVLISVYICILLWLYRICVEIICPTISHMIALVVQKYSRAYSWMVVIFFRHVLIPRFVHYVFEVNSSMYSIYKLFINNCILFDS
jgi:hypothetical protein